MHEELLVRTRSSSCKHCTRSSSAVLSTADELVAPFCSRLVEIAPSLAVWTEYTCSREQERCGKRAWWGRGGEIVARAKQGHV
eukprot:1760805-Pleurochrysis_carterae.AAC.1